MNQEFVQTERPQQRPPVDWSNIIRIFLIVLVIIAVLYFAKDWLMPREEVNIGVGSPSDVNLSAISQLERY